MRMPPPGERYVAGNWIAVAGALLVVVVGSTALLAARDALPERVVLRWVELEPGGSAELVGVLLIAAGLAVGSCLAILAIGMAMQGPAHGFMGHALGASVALGGGVYGLALGQAAGQRFESQQWVFVAMLVGAGVGVLLSRWVRRPMMAPSSPADPGPTLDVPASARLAWSGWVRAGLAMRLGFLSVVALSLTVAYWWAGYPSWSVLAPFLGALVAQLIASRRRQFAIDYSGVGLRGKYGNRPSPIFLSDIRSAEVTTISALRDFGGWGNVTAPDGRHGWITRSGEALVVHRHDKPDFLVTVDGADEAAAVLNTQVARLRAQTKIDLPHPYGDRASNAIN